MQNEMQTIEKAVLDADNKTTGNATASNHFARTVELVEMMLEHANASVLINCVRVCKQWEELFRHSKKLQRGLFLRPVDNKRIVLHEDVVKDIDEYMAAGFSEDEANIHYRAALPIRIWKVDDTAFIPVKVAVNPLLSKIFVRDASDAFLRDHAFVDLREKWDDQVEVDFGKGYGSAQFNAGEWYQWMFPGFEQPINDPITSWPLEETDECQNARVISHPAKIPGWTIMAKHDAAPNFFFKLRSCDYMLVTQPPIHRLRILMRYIDGEMVGDNFITFDTGKEPITIGYLLGALKRLAGEYKFCWVRFAGEDLFESM